MCFNIVDSKKKSATGWKVVVEKDGDFYSPATGVLYPKNGAVPSLPDDVAVDATDLYPTKGLEGYRSLMHHPEMSGMTAVFVKLSDAIELLSELRNLNPANPNLTVVKYRISGRICNGIANTGQFVHMGKVYLGTHMKIIK